MQVQASGMFTKDYVSKCFIVIEPYCTQLTYDVLITVATIHIYDDHEVCSIVVNRETRYKL